MRLAMEAFKNDVVAEGLMLDRQDLAVDFDELNELVGLDLSPLSRNVLSEINLQKRFHSMSNSLSIEEKLYDYIFAAPQQKLPEKTKSKPGCIFWIHWSQYSV